MKRMLVVAATALLGGCVSWASYPAGPGETAVKNPNDPTILNVIETGLEWVVRKYPPGTTGDGPKLAINLPQGIRERVYERMAVRVGHGAAPLRSDTATLPVYHVAQVRIRGDEAAVDIIRPVVELGAGPDGGPVYQEIRVNMRGGMGPWHIVSHREWTPGTVAQMPELNFLDGGTTSAGAGNP
jgi:hypothetical protein